MRVLHKMKIILNNTSVNFSLWVNKDVHKHYSFLCTVAEEAIGSVSSEHEKTVYYCEGRSTLEHVA